MSLKTPEVKFGTRVSWSKIFLPDIESDYIAAPPMPFETSFDTKFIIQS